MLETRLLKYFLAVAREQNITRAAETLHISQSTLSKQLTDLEDKLGVKLLIRGKRSVTLTDEGKYLRSRAQEVVDFLDQTEAELQKEDTVISGEIKIGCAQMTSMRPIIEVIAKFQEKYPDVKFRMFSGDAMRVMEKLHTGTFDIGILLSPPIEYEFNYVKLPMQESFGFIMHKDFPLAKKEVIRPGDLKNIPVIVPDQAHDGNARHEWFGNNFDSIRIISTYDLIGNAVYWAEQNLGCIFALDNLVPTEGTDLVFIPIAPAFNIDVYLATKKYQVFSSAAKLFLDDLYKRFSENIG